VAEVGPAGVGRAHPLDARWHTGQNWPCGPLRAARGLPHLSSRPQTQLPLGPNHLPATQADAYRDRGATSHLGQSERIGEHHRAHDAAHQRLEVEERTGYVS